MDAYLQIAYRVLRATKRPLTPRSILATAYSAGIMPVHLRGHTQHKTLQARLSEDILDQKERSLFYRTAPGVFFLNELRSDPEVPDRFKVAFSAQRRVRQLKRESSLAVAKTFLSQSSHNGFLDASILDEADRRGALVYANEHEVDLKSVPIWTFTIVRRRHFVLSYRLGQYREDRESFLNKRTIGFINTVTADDVTLFSYLDHGTTESALTAIVFDLGLSHQSFPFGTPERPTFKSVLEAEGEDKKRALLVVLEWECPDGFEPITRRLSLNSLSWMRTTDRINHMVDFEPWSRVVLDRVVTNEAN